MVVAGNIVMCVGPCKVYRSKPSVINPKPELDMTFLQGSRDVIILLEDRQHKQFVKVLTKFGVGWMSSGPLYSS